MVPKKEETKDSVTTEKEALSEDLVSRVLQDQRQMCVAEPEQKMEKETAPEKKPKKSKKSKKFNLKCIV